MVGSLSASLGVCRHRVQAVVVEHNATELAGFVLHSGQTLRDRVRAHSILKNVVQAR
jgi:hypothetical protein